MVHKLRLAGPAMVGDGYCPVNLCLGPYIVLGIIAVGYLLRIYKYLYVIWLGIIYDTGRIALLLGDLVHESEESGICVISADSASGILVNSLALEGQLAKRHLVSG